MTKDLLGKRIGLTFIDRMRSLNVSSIGEGGEFESLVLDCPLFRKKIEIKEFEIKMEDERTGHYLIKKTTLT